MARGRAPVRRSRSRARTWSVFLTAMVGAWLGHFVEYVRVAGWHAGVTEMTSSAHLYFMPAGAGLVAAALVVGLLLRRAWTSLGHRLRRADGLLRRAPARHDQAALPERPMGRRPAAGLLGLWVGLSALQIAIWTTQENLEAISSGHRAPWLGVISGAHILAPVVQAEIALILAGFYLAVHRGFTRRRSSVIALERLVARRWARPASLGTALPTGPVVSLSPLARWGAQRWQRPPPSALTHI